MRSHSRQQPPQHHHRPLGSSRPLQAAPADLAGPSMPLHPRPGRPAGDHKQRAQRTAPAQPMHQMTCRRAGRHEQR